MAEKNDLKWLHDDNAPLEDAIVSTIKLVQAGFCEVMDTEAMFRKAFAEMQAKRLLPAPR